MSDNNTNTITFEWVRSNLNILHRNLSIQDVHAWMSLLEQDEDRFFSLAISGYALKCATDEGKDRLSGDQLGAFAAEFVTKLVFAIRGKGFDRDMPMFAVTGGVDFTHAQQLVKEIKEKGRTA